jgi:hypothetical protein
VQAYIIRTSFDDSQDLTTAAASSWFFWLKGSVASAARIDFALVALSGGKGVTGRAAEDGCTGDNTIAAKAFPGDVTYHE